MKPPNEKAAEFVVWHEDELHYVNCDFCGAEHTIPIAIRSDGMNVVECLRCGLAFLNPRPEDEYLYRLYSEDYFQKHNGNHSTPVGYGNYNEYASSLIKNNKSFELDLIEAHRPLQGSSVLEIGCATGELLVLARNRGASTVGVEISEYAARQAQMSHNLDVRIGTLENQAFSDHSFDIVIALEVIEHVISPTNFMKEIARILRPGGTAALSTPNYRCARRWGGNWQGFQTSFEHLYFFSDEVLMRIASSQGLRHIIWATCGSGAYLQNSSLGEAKLKHLVKKLPGYIIVYNLIRQYWPKASWTLYGHGHRLIAIFQQPI